MTLTLTEFKTLIIQSLTYRTYEEHGVKYSFVPYQNGRYWSSPNMPMAEMRDAALVELEVEGRLLKQGPLTNHGFQEWRLK